MTPEVRSIPGGGERLLLLLALFVVLLIAFFSYRSWSAFNRQSEQLLITQRVAESTNGLITALADAETGQRGFLLTGRDSYLDPYRKAMVAIPGLLDSLVQAAKARPDQSARLERLGPLIRAKLDEMKETIELRNSQGLEAGIALVLTDRGKLDMDRIRQLCQEIQSVSYDRLSRESAQAFSSADQIGFVGTAGSAALFVLLIVAAMTIQSNTTKRQELIANLHRSEEQTKVARDWLQTTIQSIGDAVIATDEAGKVILLNAIAESLTGWTLEQASGLPLEQILILVNEESRQAPENPVAKALREGRVVGLANGTILTSKDGRQIPIEDSAAPIRDAANRIAGVVLVFRDVSERRAAEEKEREVAIELAQRAAIIDSSEDAIISKDLNGIVTSWNRAAERIFGYTKEEMVGRPISVLASPSRADEMPRILEQIARGEHIDHFETTRRTKEGRDIDISLTVSPIRDSNGVIIGASKISRNITERILAEKERRRQAELIERSNADLKYFAYAASHDLREPLRTIAVYTQILERHLHANIDAESSANLHAIMSATGRMAHLIDGLLEYSKAGEIGRSPTESIDTESALAAALANLEGSIEDTHAVITKDQLPSVPGDELHFIQLFQNIISNALKYRGADPPSIHVSAQTQGKAWQFSVRDNGQGISPEYHAQIFELFKRLHGQDHPGSGIGLATCKKIIELYGGRIWVESQAGEGATFFFTVPLT